MRKLFVVLLLAGACQNRNDVPATTQDPNAKPVQSDRSADPWAVPSGYEARGTTVQTRSTESSATTTAPEPSTTTTESTTQDPWANARAQFSADVDARMQSLDARISQLETEAHNLRAEKDEIAKQMSSTSDQTREQWEQFKTNVRTALSRLENELDARRSAP